MVRWTGRTRQIATLLALAGTTTLLGQAAAHAREHQTNVRADAKAEKAADTATSPPVSAEPQATTASFGDWVVRCVTAGAPARRSCETSQSLVVQNHGQQLPVAQIAFGHAGDHASPLRLTVLLPVNVAFDKPVRIGPDDAHLTSLAYRRCVPAGCFASVDPDAATMTALRGVTQPGRLLFEDAGGRELKLPLSLRGLPQALDALEKER